MSGLVSFQTGDFENGIGEYSSELKPTRVFLCREPLDCVVVEDLSVGVDLASPPKRQLLSQHLSQ